jgi:lipoyl(octanoyl) transferase
MLTQTQVEFRVSDGLLPYPEAISGMRARVETIRAGTAPELVWLVEHPPLYTAGTSADPADLLNSHDFPTFAAGRGGQWTYHGPGQRTAYVMLDLTRHHGPIRPRDVRQFVWALEEWLILALKTFDVRGERRDGRVGIWIASGDGEKKIAAIGVRVSHWVSWHGVALNVAPNLNHFNGIVPCGLRDHGVTSLVGQGIPATMEQADSALIAAWPEVFG